MPLGEETHLLDYVRMLYKRRWLAVTAFLVVFVAGVVYTFTKTPIYQAKVQLLIEPENPNVVPFRQVMEQNYQYDASDYYQTQYKVLQSRSLARRTLDAAKLWSHPQFGGTASGARPGQAETPAQSAAISAFLGSLKVSPIRNSRLVDVTFSSPDPQLAARAANALAKSYIEQNVEMHFTVSKDASDWLGTQLAEQRKKVEESELQLQAYREKGDAVALEDRQNIVVQGLSEMSAAVTRARTERIQKEAEYNRVSALQRSGGSLDSFPAILSNSLIQQLKVQLNDLQRQQGQMAEKFGDRHPEMVKVRSAIETTEARLQGEIAKVVESVRNAYLSAQAQEATLAAALEQKKGEALALNRSGITYSVLKREVESNRLIYDTLLQRAKETDVAAKDRAGSIRILDKAEVPQVPASPNRRLNLLLAFAGATVFAVGLAFFFEYLDNRIKSPDEVKGYLGLPFLGMVPAVKFDDARGSPTINNGVPRHFAEAFRTIRTNVLFSSAEDGPRSVVVTSAAPGEGKTLVATNVAMSLAQVGARVLLIDADMRKPRVQELLELKPGPGLSNLLTGRAKASEAVRTTTVPNLHVLPSGPIPPNPAELLGSQRFKELLATLKEHFDWVIIDSPPVMAVTDAVLVGHRTNGVVFVIGSEMTNRNAALSALEQLDGVSAKLMGGILNRVKIDRHSYYYSHHYRKSYAAYYSRES